MKKGLLALIVLLSTMVVTSSLANGMPQRIFDSANCFSVDGPHKTWAHYSDDYFEQQLDYLASEIEYVRDAFGWDFAVLTLDDFIGCNTHAALAKAFYEEMDLGVGERKSGILYLLDVNQNYLFLYAVGDCDDWLTENIKKEILDYQAGYIDAKVYDTAPYWCLYELQKAYEAFTDGSEYTPLQPLIPPT